HNDATDLALLKIEGDKPFPILALGESDRVEVGEWVVAIGNPFGLSRSVTTGIVSFKGRRDVNPSGRPGYYDFIQTDAAINHGNAGGPRRPESGRRGHLLRRRGGGRELSSALADRPHHSGQARPRRRVARRKSARCPGDAAAKAGCALGAACPASRTAPRTGAVRV